MTDDAPGGPRAWVRSNQADPSRAYLLCFLLVLLVVGVAWTLFFHALGWKLGC